MNTQPMTFTCKDFYGIDWRIKVKFDRKSPHISNINIWKYTFYRKNSKMFSGEMNLFNWGAPPKAAYILQLVSEQLRLLSFSNWEQKTESEEKS